MVIQYLLDGVDGLARNWDAAQGELRDPVIEEPTQYGTAYFGLVSAGAARLRPPGRHERDRAVAAARSVLAHLSDPGSRPAVSGIRPGALSMSRGSHRDFMWPALLRTVDELRSVGRRECDELDAGIADIAVPGAFTARPPSNWASVWLAGEWRRIQAGHSPYRVRDVDTWLEPFFTERIDSDLGLFREPGLPNSYDLFTRVHLQDLVAQGYRGRWSGELATLARTGLDRTLGVQLSDGSLASAHRSTAQTWTLGAQLAYLAISARQAPHLGIRAAIARGCAALGTTVRPDRTVSPVQNGLPPSWRVGYEGYTADAHYTSLALAFLLTAIDAGLTERPDVPTDDRDTAHIEHAPTWRAVRHRGSLSVHLNLAPHPAYDGFGLVDLTFGADRRLQLVSSVAHPRLDGFLNLGIARRTGDDLDVLAHRTFDQGRHASATPDGLHACASDGTGQSYVADIALRDRTVHVSEALPDSSDPMTLLVPYPRDVGDGMTTTAQPQRNGLALRHGSERLRVEVGAPIERVIHIENGFANRRGTCGLVRIDLAEPRDHLDYSVTVEE